MRNIKNYETVRDFMRGDGNVPPITWYCEERVFADGSFNYTASSSAQEQGSTEKHYKGRVMEIVPGVAYINESGLTVYNKSKFPEISATTQTRTTNWEEFGITQELYDKYRSAIINREFPRDFNATLGNSRCGGAGLQMPNEHFEHEFLILSCGNYEYDIHENGVVEILSNIM